MIVEGFVLVGGSTIVCFISLWFVAKGLAILTVTDYNVETDDL
jgi:hypothetical protein